MKAAVTAYKGYTISRIDHRVYGAFLEHLGRAVYGGIYEPDHPTADADGMRGDVAEMVRELNVPFVRYPGGNFVSAYNWEDGIGPKDQRPAQLDLAWHTTESNQVGVHEFAAWCDTVGTEMMLALNLGSRGLEEARNFVEYVNHPGGSKWSDMRRKNGRAEPWDVKLWCLGNEMDGPWQIGHKTADEYGRLAEETAKALRAFDPSLELIVCGSSHANMPTFPQWEATVLEHTYDVVDHISLHMYFRNPEKNTGDYLALNEKLDAYIGTVAGVISYVKAKKRSKKDITICFDEWNVWYHSNEQDRKILEGRDGWPEAPPLLEDIYNFEDVLQVGCILNTFIRRSDVVKLAAIAQLVNVIAPIMTETGGSAWRQTTFFPFFFASKYGRGNALHLLTDCPGYDCVHGDNVPYVDVAGVHDEEGGFVTFFAVNRNQTEAMELDLTVAGFGSARIVEHKMIRHDSLEAVNTADKPDEVAPQDVEGANLDGERLSANLPSLSYHMIRVAVS
ncbi:alpha-L-arabinofuranosidase [Oceanicola granulosus HTCC2516]|uniref:non-reducing end alpha-L-arabinofuranosidase n=1 Tax=Oceanicola granulosus (strain ATCC BAA-861 / DSM 15982 / KCTC 12143 / HTCC2516) TaxID=314256 RepID=Q2CJJ1_OCEGH|nr:alpha-N-arabinofuranosidase [Oceanicola granulosus]EAR53148.1 alpha-L-arabinofuranosidase [Oceanicola granulosus HTCC2516]